MTTRKAKKIPADADALRMLESWTQELIGTKQPVIARLEDADYQGHSLAMLYRIGAALWCGVAVRFVPGSVRPTRNLQQRPARSPARRSTCSRYLGRSLLAVLLSLASVGMVAQSPKPSNPDDVEMGVAAAPSARAKVDPRVLARFEVEYRRASGASRPVFDKYLPILGSAALLDYLEGRFPECHRQAHNLGRALYALRKNVGTALGECGTRCTSACMHGVVGEAFGTTALGSIAGTMDEFCVAGAMAQIHRPGNCAHGIGHALMFTTGDDVDRALNTCLYFGDPGMRYYCATGVFMEYLIPRRKGTARPVLHDPCDLYPQYAAACYRYRARTILGELGGDRKKLLRQCQSLQGPLRLGCFHGLGSTLTSRLIGDPSLLGRICGKGDAKDRIMCIEGAIEKLADYDETKAMSACAMLEGANREVCAAAAKGKMYQLGKPSMPLYHDSKLVETREPLVNQPKAHEHGN